MNLKKLLTAFAPFLLAACQSVDNNSIAGEWVEPIPGIESQVQGIRLEENGKATSINMATLQYESWERTGNKLILKGKSIGNRQTIEFVDTLNICKHTTDSLVLNRDGLKITYLRKEKEAANIPAKTVLTVKGKLVIGHEVRSFVADNDTVPYWVVDETGKLKEEYEKIATISGEYIPVHVELKVKDMGKSDDGFAADYAGVYQVVEIIGMSK